MTPAAQAPGKVNSYARDKTFGGYSNVIVVKQDFLLKIPPTLSPAVAAPILGAGVTTSSPLKHWGVQAGQRVGIVGFGGLGHPACKLAMAMGAEVTVSTHTDEKLTASSAIGITAVSETDQDAFVAMKSSFDFILSTIPEKHDINPYGQWLKRDCTVGVVGALEPLQPINDMELAFHRKHVAGSLIGNLTDTQEVLDFCAKHQIGPDIQLIDIEEVNDAYDRVEKGEVRFRYVINMASLGER